MRYTKIYFGVVALLLVVSIIFILYIWAKVQSLETVKNTVTNDYVTEPEKPEDTGTTPAEPITVDVNTLPESQKKALKAVGIDATSFTITAEMATCAKETLGKERLDQIISGAAPTPLETLTLLPCIKR